MKKILKIKFVDFWGNLNEPGNIFYKLLSNYYEVEFSENPDVLFYSSYGLEHLKYKCVKFFFSGENERPNYNACDFSISFDYSNNPKHYRFPLWAFYYWVYINGIKIQKLDLPINEQDLNQLWQNKTKFCCFIVSNPNAKKRNDFFEELSKRKFVDSAGKYKNNIGYFLEGGTLEKLEFIKPYKFVISYENSSYDGYTTEKILEPMLANCIPIYWGDPKVNKDFNSKRFINYFDFKSEKEMIDRIMEIDSDDALAVSILKQKCFESHNKSLEDLTNGLSDFMFKHIENRNKISPIAQSVYFSFMYKIDLLKIKIKNKILFLKQKFIKKV